MAQQVLSGGHKQKSLRPDLTLKASGHKEQKIWSGAAGAGGDRGMEHERCQNPISSAFFIWKVGPYLKTSTFLNTREAGLRVRGAQLKVGLGLSTTDALRLVTGSFFSCLLGISCVISAFNFLFPPF